MKLINHVLKIRSLVQQAIDNRFAKMGIKDTGLVPIESLPKDLIPKRQKLEDILNNHLSELQDYSKARQETINECTFTLFNKIAAIKVMEEKELFPEVIKRRPENGNKSFAHNLWLEENPAEKSAERQGLKHFLQAKFNELGENFSLYNENYPYSLMPTADELFNILEAFNEVEDDLECGANIWKGDDVLGWLYEDFNAVEKEALKNTGEKTEYDKVSLQSQFYTPNWVVKFLVDNTLGKYYLEMFPDSDIIKPDPNGNVRYKIANAPKNRTKDVKRLEELRVIDPACGSGNFLIYSFDLLYNLYINQIEQYGADYSRRDIPKLILENNIYGVDLDERAVQLSQIALFIKARELGGRRVKNPSHTNVVSSHFFLPHYSEVESVFISSGEWDKTQQETIKKIWSDLQNAHKFGSLIRIEEVLDGLSLKDTEGLLFAEEMAEDLFSFKRRVTEVLRDQVKAYCEKNASEYALTKAEDAMTFLRILSMPFDVVVANPPYTDSSDFGPYLKRFIDDNYRLPLRFNTNLFSSFIKRCSELAGLDGRIGMVNPPSFMYIKSFEDVRKYIVEDTHINVFVEWGYLGMFSSTARVDSAMYVLEKNNNSEVSTFIKLNDLYEMKRKPTLDMAYNDLIEGKQNDRVYNLNQTILKTIKGYPFIYWISDDFRSKFLGADLDSVLDIKQGIATADNNRFLRFWWEVLPSTISQEQGDNKKWVKYSKGGPYNKWYGNLWTVINWGNDGYEIKHFTDANGRVRSAVRNSDYYFRDAITYTSSGSKGATFRYLPENYLFDSGGSCIFTNKYKDLYYVLAFLNTKLSFYICDCLNPTVNTTQGDLWRIPFVEPQLSDERIVSDLARQNVEIKKHILSYSIVETNFNKSPICEEGEPRKTLADFYSKECLLQTIILLNEAVINKIVMKVYNLSAKDIDTVIQKEGVPVATLPVSSAAISAFKKALTDNRSYEITSETESFINTLEVNEMEIKLTGFETLFQANNEWEDYCVRNNVNPIEAWYQFTNADIIPSQRSQQLAFELITDIIRTVLAKDDDGIIPLIDRAGKDRMEMRIEQELHERGYSFGAISQIIQLLGTSLDNYLTTKYFAQLTERLNLFQYLPKTPFIWHITSGPHHGLELYASIYTWNRDTLFRIKSVYAANREASLKEKLNSINTTDPIGSMEANTIHEQLNELRHFCSVIDELLASGYSPSIDDGVAKNIAPLQAKGLLAYSVLNTGQLKKYLNADW